MICRAARSGAIASDLFFYPGFERGYRFSMPRSVSEGAPFLDEEWHRVWEHGNRAGPRKARLEEKREERADGVVPEDGGATNRGTGESRGGAVGRGGGQIKRAWPGQKGGSRKLEEWHWS